MKPTVKFRTRIIFPILTGKLNAFKEIKRSISFVNAQNVNPHDVITLKANGSEIRARITEAIATSSTNSTIKAQRACL
jgi:hypothetical protein